MFDSKQLRRVAATLFAVPALLVVGAGTASADSFYSAHVDGASPEGAYSKGVVAAAKDGKHHKDGMAFYHKHWDMASPEGASSGSITSAAR